MSDLWSPCEGQNLTADLVDWHTHPSLGVLAQGHQHPGGRFRHLHSLEVDCAPRSGMWSELVSRHTVWLANVVDDRLASASSYATLVRGGALARRVR